MENREHGDMVILPVCSISPITDTSHRIRKHVSLPKGKGEKDSR